MRTSSPHHTEVFSHLPALLRRELDSAAVAQVLDDLVAQGWRPGQLRHRVGAEPAQGSVEKDAAQLLELLISLRTQDCPDVLHERVKQARARQREWEQQHAPRPASPHVRQARIDEIRKGLKGAPRRRREPQPRVRPACSLCQGEGAYFVTRDVHLCTRCVDVMATGQARLSEAG